MRCNGGIYYYYLGCNLYSNIFTKMIYRHGLALMAEVESRALGKGSIPLPVTKHIKNEVICPYCNKKAIWCENRAIYGRNYGRSYMCYLCKDCDAYVGCHNNTKKPLGTLANRDLRRWRMRAHAEFDPIWKSGQHRKRHKAYGWLARELGVEEIHIGESDIETCIKIIELSKAERQRIVSLTLNYNDPRKM